MPKITIFDAYAGTIEDICIQYHNYNCELKANNTIYSDRLLQWDYAKYNKLSNKHFNNEAQYWYDRDASKVEAFLRDWCNDDTLILISINVDQNVSNGYPVWRFDFYTKEA